jgi:hypothetical protein
MAGAHLSRKRSPRRPKEERPTPIRIEVFEQFRIYLMSDVIAQSSASLDFAFVSAKLGLVTEGPLRSRSRRTTAWRSRGQPLAQLAARRDLRLRERSPRPGEKGQKTRCRQLAFAESYSKPWTVACQTEDGKRRLIAVREGTGYHVDADNNERPSGNAKRQ